MAKDMLVRAKPVSPCSFSLDNLRIQKAKVGVFLCLLAFLDYFFIEPCNQQGNQVRIYNKSLVILSVLYW